MMSSRKWARFNQRTGRTPWPRRFLPLDTFRNCFVFTVARWHQIMEDPAQRLFRPPRRSLQVLQEAHASRKAFTAHDRSTAPINVTVAAGPGHTMAVAWRPRTKPVRHRREAWLGLPDSTNRCRPQHVRWPRLRAMIARRTQFHSQQRYSMLMRPWKARVMAMTARPMIMTASAVVPMLATAAQGAKKEATVSCSRIGTSRAGIHKATETGTRTPLLGSICGSTRKTIKRSREQGENAI